MTENNEMIRVNVPETSGKGFFRLRKAAFFETDKGTFKKMLKALSADVENLPDNARALLEYANERGNAYIIFNHAADRVKTFEAILKAEKHETAAQKKMNKAIQAFCSKNENRHILTKPFYNNGKLYASDSFAAVMIENPAVYTGEFFAEESEEGRTPCMEKFFSDIETVKNTFIPVTIPDVSVFKTWSKNGKFWDETGENPRAVFQAAGHGINAAMIYKCLVLTDADTIYINPKPFKPSYIIGGGFVCLVLPMRDSFIGSYPAVCLYHRGYNGETVLDLTDPAAFPVKQKRTRKTRKTASKETVTTEEKTTEETETKAETSCSPAGKELVYNTAAADVTACVNDSKAVKSSENNVNPADIPQKEPNTSQDPEKIYKITNLAYTAAELENIISQKLYLLKYAAVYAVEKTARGGYKAVNLYKINEHAARVPRGGFTWVHYETVKNLFPWFPAPFYGTVMLTVNAKPAADPVADSIPENVPDNIPETVNPAEPTKTAQNGAEGIKGITVHPGINPCLETLKKPIMQCNNDISFPAGRPAVIPERILKNEYLHKPHEIPKMHHMPVMHEMYNMPKMHNFGNQGFPSAPSAVSAFCEKLYHVLPVLPSVPSAFCRIPAGIPPG